MGFFDGIGNWIGNAARTIGTGIKNVGDAIGTGAKNVASFIGDKVKPILPIVGAVSRGLANAAEFGSDLGIPLTGSIAKGLNFVADRIDDGSANRLATKIETFNPTATNIRREAETLADKLNIPIPVNIQKGLKFVTDRIDNPLQRPPRGKR
jgi:hypothetical protein